MSDDSWIFEGYSIELRGLIKMSYALTNFPRHSSTNGSKNQQTGRGEDLRVMDWKYLSDDSWIWERDGNHLFEFSNCGVRVIHLGRSTCHAISGWGNYSTVRRGHLLTSHGEGVTTATAGRAYLT